MAWYLDLWEQKYPHTIDFLKDGFLNEAIKDKVWKAFVDVSQLAADAAKTAVTFGKDSNAPPLIWFTDLGNRSGEFDADQPNAIKIATRLAAQFERQPTISGARQYLASKILHEMVHWALHQNGLTEQAEMGLAFENQAYGEPLTPFWLDDAARRTLQEEIRIPSPPLADSAARKLEPGEFSNDDLKAALPRGIRNNNPGNIRRSATAWEGIARPNELKPFQIGENAFCVFSEAKFGIRAMAIILRNYQRKIGLRTVSGMINRWAPPSDNNTTDDYIRTVSGAMGIAGEQPFDFADSALGPKMLSAMIRVENGMQPYSANQLSSGHAMATL